MKHFQSIAISCILALSLSIVVGCGSGGSTPEEDANILQTDSMTYSNKNSFAECEIAIDYPRDTTSLVGRAIVEFIVEQMEYCNLDALGFGDEPISEDSLAGYEPSDPYFCHADIRKGYETDSLVTFHSQVAGYTGGAHGWAFVYGATFHKDSGQQLTWDIFRDTSDPAFKRLIVDGLKDYINSLRLENDEEVTTDKDLCQWLLWDDANNNSNIEDISLPKCPPFFTDNGIEVIYQQYEIAPYAIGLPQFTIPYDKACEFLRDPNEYEE